MNNKRIALITGANKGIGLETARQLGKEGITVLVGARDEKKSNGATEELRKEGIDAYGLVIDVDNGDSIQKAVASVDHEHGRLDILINNAGVMLHGADKSVSEEPLDVWRKTFETNFLALSRPLRRFSICCAKAMPGES